MTERSEQDWKDLEYLWKSQTADLEFSAEGLQRRLRVQRTVLALQTAAEIAGFVLCTLLAIWMIAHSVAGRFGTMLLVWLFLLAPIVLWLRRRGPTLETANVMNRLDENIERDERVVLSMRLGSVMSMSALAGMIMAVCWALFGKGAVLTPVTLAGITLVAIYVFAVQVTIMVSARRVSRHRKRLEEIRRVLRAPEWLSS
jgi:hypothetical protein